MFTLRVWSDFPPTTWSYDLSPAAPRGFFYTNLLLGFRLCCPGFWASLNAIADRCSALLLE
jgi:hypothetical protein